MMLPTRTPEKSYHSLEELHQRKEELAAQIRQDNDRFGTLWKSVFSAPKDGTKGEMIANIVSHSVTAIDAFLLVRKLMKNYGFLFGRKRK